MTDAGWLTLVLLIVYVVECIEIVPAQTLVLVTRGQKKGLLRKPIITMPGINRAVCDLQPIQLAGEGIPSYQLATDLPVGQAIYFSYSLW